MFLTPSITGLIALTSLPFSVRSGALHPDIRADTNRDGQVDTAGDTDLPNKAVWTPSSGAIFLPNIGDATGRCPDTDLTGQPLSSTELALCNDASGDDLLSPEYIAPLQTVPMADLSEDAYGHVYATPDATYDRVRLFWKEDSRLESSIGWRRVEKWFRFNATQLQSGLVLGIDSRELVTDSKVWDGSVLVRFDVYDRPDSGSDVVALKLAPVLTHHHLQPVDTILSIAGSAKNTPQRRFLSDLDKARRRAGVEEPIFLFNETGEILFDQWAQDFFEPAYASMPGPNGPIAIRVMIRSAQSTRTAGRHVFETLRGKGVGGFQPAPGFGFEEINSFGNLETIPPYTSKSGVEYKAGRIITSKHFDKMPAESMLTFLECQGMQSPLVLESGWLLIGHVDEFVQFLPFGNELGWTIAVPDTKAAFEVLEDIQRKGHGGVKAISFNGTAGYDGGWPGGYGSPDPDELRLTVDDLLRNETFKEVNEYAQRHIDANLQVLLSDIDLPPADIIRIPILFKTPTFEVLDLGDGYPPRITPPIPGEMQVMSLWPETINGVVLGKHYIAPKPWGPIVEGRDVLAEAVKEVYAKANMSVSFVDDFLSHHVWGGEVHCGSNTLRETAVEWWD